MLLIFFSLIQSYRDIKDGLEYEDESMKKLIGGYSGTKSVVVKRSVEIIKGGSNEIEGFAYPFRLTLENLTFEEDGNLSIIGDYSFHSTYRLKILNLSSCRKLRSIQSWAFHDSGVETLIFPSNGVFESTGQFCFQGTKITSVVYPKSLVKVGHSMFKGAKSLQSVTFEEGSKCTTIEYYAFEASGIKRIVIPKSVSSLNAKSFALCRSLSEILVEYGSDYFVSENNILYTKGYSSLVCFPRAWEIDLVVRDGVTKILDEAFRSCSVWSIVFPSSLISVGYSIVCECSNLTSIEFKDGVKTMDTHALQYCSIQRFVVPKSLTYLNKQLLKDCTSLKEVVIHENVTLIQEECFLRCSSLEYLEVPEGNLQYINEYSFKDCIKLKEVILPQSIKSLGGGLFENCHPNLSVKFRGNGELETDENRIIYREHKKVVIQMYAEIINPDIVLPSTVISILKGAFAGRGIRSIIFNSNIENIEERAFAKCSNLKSFTFPFSVQYLGPSTFEGSNIENVSLSNINSLPDKTFKSCLRLESIIITSSVQSIGSECFAGAYNLKNIEFEVGKMSTISSKAFWDCKSLQSITFPASIMNLSQSICYGNSVTSISFDDGCKMESIPKEAFMNSNSLKKIEFPSIIISLDSYCLSNCIQIEHITITKTIMYLKDYCLSGCQSLKFIEIEEGTRLKSIEETALEGLNNLESIEIRGNSEFFKTSEDRAVLYSLYNHEEREIIKYCGMNKRREFEIPDTVEIISGCSFEGAVNLERVVIGEKVVGIGSRAFSGCISLEFLEISDSVETIGFLAFEGCLNLKCGCVKYPTFLKEELIQSGLREESLNKCITRDFTIISTFQSINGQLFSLLLPSDNE